MTAKIIQFPLDRVGKREASLPAETVARRLVEIEIGPAARPGAPTRRTSVFSDDTLADLHEAITGLFGWDEAHNYFFSQGCSRYEDPILFASQDRVTARCRKIYSAAETPVGAVMLLEGAPLFYVYNLTAGCELRIALLEDVAAESVG